MFEITGITKVHYLIARDDGLIADELSCTSCIPSSLCADCQIKDYYQLECEEDISYEEDEDGERIYENGDLGHSDDDYEEVENDEGVLSGNSCFGPGDIVWAKWKLRYFPAKVISYNELNSSLKAKLLRSKDKLDYVIVQWNEENNYSWVYVGNMYELSENKCDASNAAVDEDVTQRYQMALADLRHY